MASRLVYDLATAAGAAGFRAVRFDYRGVGRSAGAYGLGEGEAADGAAVFDAVAAETGKMPAVIGYSFGGAVACRLATVRRPERLVVVATPLRLEGSRLDPPRDAPRIICPVTLVVGTHDDFVPLADARALAAAFPAPAGLRIVDGAAHFLEPSRNADAVAAVLQSLSG
jgi:alpha/beta superfamily hydrolase